MLLRNILILLVSCVVLHAQDEVFISATTVTAASGGSYTKLFNVAKGGNISTATTTGVDSSGATLIVVAVTYFNAGPAVLSDSKGNTWTALTQYGGAAYDFTLFYCVNPTVGASHTFTANGANFPNLAVIGFSGNAGTPFDVENGSTVSGFGPFQPGSITPSQNNEVVISGICWSDGASVSVNSGFTLTDQAQNTDGGIGVAIAYKIQTSAASVNPSWTTTSNNSGGVGVASFK